MLSKFFICAWLAISVVGVLVVWCGGVVQYIAVYCSVLQCLAVCRSVMQCGAVCCSEFSVCCRVILHACLIDHIGARFVSLVKFVDRSL